MVKNSLGFFLILNLFACGFKNRNAAIKPASLEPGYIPSFTLLHERETNDLLMDISFLENIDSNSIKEFSNPPKFSWAIQLSNGELLTLTTESPGKIWTKKSPQLNLISRGNFIFYAGPTLDEIAVLPFIDSPGVTVRSTKSSNLIDQIEWAWSLNENNRTTPVSNLKEEFVTMYFKQISGGRYSEFTVREGIQNNKTSNKGHFLLAELKDFDLKFPISFRGCHTRLLIFNAQKEFPSGARLKHESCGVYQEQFFSTEMVKN